MNNILQCPKGCGRLVRRDLSPELPGDSWVNAGGAWAGFPHNCTMDGANARGDNDDSPTRAEELKAWE